VARQRGKYLIADLRDLVERPGTIVGVVVVVVGGGLLLLGLVGAILVGPGSTWRASKTVDPKAPAVIVTSGVVGAVGPRVTLTAQRTDGGDLFVGRAISSDVTDLTGNTPRLVVSGVHPLHRLSAATRPGTTSLAKVQSSDIWRERSVGGGPRTLVWRPDSESQSVLISSTDGAALPALRISVTWHRSGWFPAAVFLILVGGVVLTIGLHTLTGARLLHRLTDFVLRGLSKIPMPARRPSPTTLHRHAWPGGGA
jgi:hypothetical protein